MKLKFLLLFSVLGFSFSTTAQEGIDEEDNVTGYYINNGKLKIDTLKCTEFDKLVLKVKIRPEYFSQDRVRIVATIGDLMGPMGLFKKKIVKSRIELVFNYKKETFANYFKGKEYFYIYLQTDDTNDFKLFVDKTIYENNMEIENTEAPPLTKHFFKYTNVAEDAGYHYVHFRIIGRNITSVEQYYDAGTRSYKTRDIYSSKDLYDGSKHKLFFKTEYLDKAAYEKQLQQEIKPDPACYQKR